MFLSRPSLALPPGLLTVTFDRQFIEDIFVPIFAGLNILSAFFEQPAPDLFPKLHSTPSGDPPSVPNSFSNLNEARIYLTNLANMVVDFDVAAEQYRHVTPDYTRMVTRQLEMEAKLHQWSSAYAEFLKTSLADMGSDSEDIRGTTLLRIQHKGILLLLTSSLTGGLPLLEKYNSDFETIISLSEFMMQDPPTRGKYHPRSFRSSRFSFEMGIIPQLYLTATRCQSAPVRQKALDILSASPRQEGLWDSAQARSAAEKVMGLRGVDSVKYTWKDLGQFEKLMFKPTQPL